MKRKTIVKALSFVFATASCFACAALNVNAATGAGAITSSFGTLQDLIATTFSSIGAILLMWGFFEFGISFQSQEGTVQAQAFKRIGGALIMCLAPQLISAFTFS